MTDQYAGRIAGDGVRGRVFRSVAAAMRVVDRRAAEGVDRYVANSQHVAAQIRMAYGRDAAVINPPVDCGVFRPSAAPGHDGYYLFCGRLVEPYKQPGIVIDAFRALRGRRLVVAGDGPAYRHLKARAGPDVEFVGHLKDEGLVPLMQRCAATIFPSADDFGMIPLEAMACGRPVLAFAGGGALETVVRGTTGEFFPAQTSQCLRKAVEEFDPNAYGSTAIRRHAERWHVDRFQEALLDLRRRYCARSQSIATHSLMLGLPTQGRMSMRATIRELLARPDASVLMGVHSALGAKIAEENGADGLWISSFEVHAAARLPDADILGTQDYVT